MHKFIIILSLVAVQSSFSQNDLVKEVWLEKWKNSKEYLITIAEAMPEDKYNYKPTEREMSVGEQLLHIRNNMLWLGTTYFSDETFDRSVLQKDIPVGKNAIIEAVRLAFEEVYEKVNQFPGERYADSVDFFAGEKKRIQILNLLQDHVSHHRGQLIVYLNLNAIEPPPFTGW